MVPMLALVALQSLGAGVGDEGQRDPPMHPLIAAAWDPEEVVS